MRRRASLLVGLLLLASSVAGGLLLAPAPARTGAPPLHPAGAAAAAGAHRLKAPKAKRVRPRAFASCAGLIRYARSHFAVTHGRPDPPVAPVSQPAPAGSPATPGPSATAAPVADGNSGAGTTYSTTNVQEPGVDEPDIVKTDGATIFVVSQDALRAVAVGGGTPRLVGSLPLGPSGYGSQLLLRGTKLLVISGSGGPVPLGVGVATPARSAPASSPGRARSSAAARPVPSPAIAPSPYYYGGKTTLTEVDVSNPSAMKVTQTLTFDGSFVDARQNGSTARLVISSAPRAIAAAGVRGSAAGWVPSLQFHDMATGSHSAHPVAPCGAIYRPVQFSGLGMLTIVTINLDRSLASAHSDSLMADAQVVYGSQNSLYVATQKWIDPQTAAQRLPVLQTTVIDRFDTTNPDKTTFVAAGEVPGYLLNQFSLSENNGFLRVATTSRPIWWAGVVSPGAPRPPTEQSSQSLVTVLTAQGGVLVPVGQVTGLGQGQQIYSVRFVGDTGYVVTFRQVDPLYVIDLSSPTTPKVAGQLELQGYSAYLHPLGNGLLLGVGQDVGGSNGNEPAGSQLELFDVSQASAPKLLARTTLGNGSSTEVAYDHHAFLFWPPTNLAVLPVQIYRVSPPPTPQGSSGSGGSAQGSSGAAAGSSSNSQFVGAIGFHVDHSGIAEVGRVTHDAVNGYTPAIRRSVVIGNQLFTVSDGGVMASSLDTLARQAFVAFPQPQPQPGPTPQAGAPTQPPKG